LDVTDTQIMQRCLEIYKELEDCGISALLDDRDERAGVKFKDAELIGIPVIVTLGKKTLKENKVEIKSRKQNKEVFLIDRENVKNKITQLLEAV